MPDIHVPALKFRGEIELATYAGGVSLGVCSTSVSGAVFVDSDPVSGS